MDNSDDRGEELSQSEGEEHLPVEETVRELVKTRKKRGGRTAPDKEQLFVLPLTRRPFFPGMAAPLVIEPGPYYEVLKIVARSPTKRLALFLTKEEEVDIYKIGFRDLCSVGVMADILRIVALEQGGAQVVLNMERRIKIKKKVPRSKYLAAEVVYHDDRVTKMQSKIIKAYSINIITTIKELLKLNPLFKEELQIFLGHSDFTEPGKLADFAVALTTAGRDELQEILATFDVQTRIDKTLILLKKELDISKLQSSINRKIEAGINDQQRKFFLEKQLRAIKRELGLEKDDKSCDLDKFRERLKQRTVPEEVQKVIEEEMDKLGVLDIQSAEYGVCRNYLDWLTVLPWGIVGEENKRLSVARKILDADHYGLEDAKERILEFMCVGKLTHGIKGTIICLVGPPGVGKTSVGKSIARALHRKFYRFSVGGMRNEDEIKGHRRTYIGSMPGKFAQALKKVQEENPVILIDEVDKIGTSSGQGGDPAAALLEVLDPEQNGAFLDHYLDVPCDLSKVLFILTANVTDTIPDVLADRTEVIRLPGYIEQEKVEIAKRHLIPRKRKTSGLSGSQIRLTEGAIRMIINGYAREAGVRSLDKHIGKIMRKFAVELVSDEEKQEQSQKQRGKKSKSQTRKQAQEETRKSKTGPLNLTLTRKNVEDYLGEPRFTSDRYYQQTPIGVCTGLAWTSLGGAILYIESIAVKADKNEMLLTGRAGDVMKESARIAWSYAASCVDPFFDNQKVHIHIPEGATPKDGPSAGIAMVTSILSLVTQQKVVKDLGMTGEITLTGQVLPIGGVKEKIIAAKRSKLKLLIFPDHNRRDYDELPDYLKEGIKIHFVKSYEEVQQIAFPQGLVNS